MHFFFLFLIILGTTFKSLAHPVAVTDNNNLTFDPHVSRGIKDYGHGTEHAKLWRLELIYKRDEKKESFSMTKWIRGIIPVPSSHLLPVKSWPIAVSAPLENPALTNTTHEALATKNISALGLPLHARGVDSEIHPSLMSTVGRWMNHVFGSSKADLGLFKNTAKLTKRIQDVVHKIPFDWMSHNLGIDRAIIDKFWYNDNPAYNWTSSWLMNGPYYRREEPASNENNPSPPPIDPTTGVPEYTTDERKALKMQVQMKIAEQLKHKRQPMICNGPVHKVDTEVDGFGMLCKPDKEKKVPWYNPGIPVDVVPDVVEVVRILLHETNFEFKCQRRFVNKMSTYDYDFLCSPQELSPYDSEHIGGDLEKNETTELVQREDPALVEQSPERRQLTKEVFRAIIELVYNRKWQIQCLKHDQYEVSPMACDPINIMPVVENWGHFYDPTIEIESWWGIWGNRHGGCPFPYGPHNDHCVFETN